MKKGSVLLGLIFVGLFFTSCSKSTQLNQGEDTLARIERTGQIDACTVINPPLVMKEAGNGKYSGIFVDAMNIIAQKMNAKVAWHETTYGNAAGDLASNRCDVVVTDFFATIPRAESVAFTEPPLAYEGLTAVIRKSDTRLRNSKDISDLDRPNFTISVATGSGGDIFVTQHFHKAQIKRIDVQGSDTARHLVEVSANRADASIFNMNYDAYYVRRHPELVELFHDHPFSVTPLGWAVRQDDVKWLHFLETALQFLDTQGTMAQLEKKYNAHLIHLVKQYKVQ